MERFTLRRIRGRASTWLAPASVGLLIVVALACAPRKEAPAPPAPEPQVAAPTPSLQTFTATAYTIEGRTASGSHTRQGIVAADPKILPIGSRIRVSDAGQYSGVYTVADTGRAIHGREIDIYIPNNAAAKKFGKKTVKVEVLHDGKGDDDGGKPRRAGDAPPAGTTP